MIPETPGYQDMLLLAENQVELREKCSPSRARLVPCPCGPGDTVETTYYRRLCKLCGVSWPSFEAWTHPHHQPEVHSDKCACQGRGWILPTPETWMGKLVNLQTAWLGYLELVRITDDLEQQPYYHCWIRESGTGVYVPGDGPAPEAALAAALVAAQEGD